MNRIMRRWVKAGALIFVATLVVAACEGPAGPTGTAGAWPEQPETTAHEVRQVTQAPPVSQVLPVTKVQPARTERLARAGRDGVPAPPLFFSYAPFNEATSSTTVVPDTNIRGRFLDIPFPAEAANVVPTITEDQYATEGEGFEMFVEGTPDTLAVSEFCSVSVYCRSRWQRYRHVPVHGEWRRDSDALDIREHHG